MTGYGSTRREALKVVGAMGAMSSLALLAPKCLLQASDAPSQILKRPIPATGEALPIIGFGTSRVFDVNAAEGKRRPLRKALALLLESGGTVIDTAHNYNRAEAVVGDLLQDLHAQHKAFLSTKVYAAAEDEGKAQIELSFKRLGKPVIDLYFIHNLVGLHTQMKTLLSYKEEGKIRYWGLSHYSSQGIDQILNYLESGLQPNFVQVPYSLAVPYAENKLLPLAKEKGIAVIANQPFAKGLLFKKVKGLPVPHWVIDMGIESWAQFFLKYMTSHDGVHCVIPGTGKIEHAADNIKAGMGYMLTGRERKKMMQFWKNL